MAKRSREKNKSELARNLFISKLFNFTLLKQPESWQRKLTLFQQSYCCCCCSRRGKHAWFLIIFARRVACLLLAQLWPDFQANCRLVGWFRGFFWCRQGNEFDLRRDQRTEKKGQQTSGPERRVGQKKQAHSVSKSLYKLMKVFAAHTALRSLCCSPCWARLKSRNSPFFSFPSSTHLANPWTRREKTSWASELIRSAAKLGTPDLNRTKEYNILALLLPPRCWHRKIKDTWRQNSLPSSSFIPREKERKLTPLSRCVSKKLSRSFSGVEELSFCFQKVLVKTAGLTWVNPPQEANQWEVEKRFCRRSHQWKQIEKVLLLLSVGLVSCSTKLPLRQKTLGNKCLSDSKRRARGWTWG